MNTKTKRSLAALAAIPLMALGTPMAMAGGNGATTFTQTDHAVAESFSSPNPCTLDPGTVSDVHNDVFHGTTNKTGTWFTGTIEGKFTFTPDDPSKVTYTGHFTTWFGDENNLRNGVEHSTFNVNALGTDGTHLQFYDNAQATVNANGVVTVVFDHASCG